MPYRWLWEAFAVIATRGIEPHEVMQALSAARRRPVPALSPEGLPVLTVWARTNAGRPLIVTVRRVARFDALIIGARDLDADEKGEFEAWETNR